MLVNLARDRAPSLSSGVRPRDPRGRGGHVLAPEPASAALPGPRRGRALRGRAGRPHGRPDRDGRARPARRHGGRRRDRARVATAFERRGFSVERDGFTHADGTALVNVIGRRAGRSRRQIVVVAARDARGVPDVAGSAADTAALLELARVFEGRPTDQTLVLASVDGSALGEVGAERLAGSLGSPDLIDGRDRDVEPRGEHATRLGDRAVVERHDPRRDRPRAHARRVAPRGARAARRVAPGSRGQLVTRWRSRSGSAPRARSSTRASTRCASRAAASCRPTARRRRWTATRFGGSAGPRCAPSPRSTGPAAAEHGPQTYLIAVSQVMPGWAIALLALALLLPAAGGLGRRVRACAPPARAGGRVAALARRLVRAVRGRAGRGRAARARGRHAGAAARSRAALRHPARRPGRRRCSAGSSCWRRWSFWLARRLIVRSDPRVCRRPVVPARRPRSPSSRRSRPCCSGSSTRSPRCWRCPPRTSGCSRR